MTTSAAARVRAIAEACSRGFVRITEYVYNVFVGGSQIARVSVVEQTPGGGLSQPSVEFLLTDTLGTPRTVTDQDGNILRNQSASPYGQMSDLEGPGFTGHRHDQDLGLIDMRGRLYDPAVQRFMQADPVISAPFFSEGLNPYSYAFNSPLNWVDPSGLVADCATADCVNAVGEAYARQQADASREAAARAAAEGAGAGEAAAQGAAGNAAAQLQAAVAASSAGADAALRAQQQAGLQQGMLQGLAISQQMSSQGNPNPFTNRHDGSANEPSGITPSELNQQGGTGLSGSETFVDFNDLTPEQREAFNKGNEIFAEVLFTVGGEALLKKLGNGRWVSCWSASPRS